MLGPLRPLQDGCGAAAFDTVFVKDSTAGREKRLPRSSRDLTAKKAIQLCAEQYEKTYLNWMENIHRLVHLAATLVGTPYPCLALRGLPQDYRGA